MPIVDKMIKSNKNLFPIKLIMNPKITEETLFTTNVKFIMGLISTILAFTIWQFQIISRVEVNAKDITVITSNQLELKNKQSEHLKEYQQFNRLVIELRTKIEAINDDTGEMKAILEYLRKKAESKSEVR